MPEDKWRKESSGLIIDEYDSFYQASLLNESIIKTSTSKAKDIYIRSRDLAINRMKIENYQCEYDPKHNLFISRGTKLPYLESHHLVPISLQRSLEINLDLLDNIYCLCPFCHRAIHHAEAECTKQIIDKLVNKRQNILDHLKIGQTELYQIYAVEEII
jgi:5-methylcytosine-specific restriction protein A